MHDGAPCPPWGSMQCGLVGRTLGPGRPRVTPNASAPHNGLLGPGGFAVVPINIATQQGLLPKGARPTTAMAMAAMATLLGVAYTLGGAAFVVAGGPKPCPNQLRLAPFGHHKAGMAHPPRVRVGRTRPATDTVLGFGAKVAPGVAQRFGTPLANCMGHTIGLGGQKWVAGGRAPTPAFGGWCRRRGAHGLGQIRLWCMVQCTNDPYTLAVGAGLVHRVAKAWHWLALGMGAMVATPKKRTLGAPARWLGTKFLANLGVCYLPAGKALRAVQGATLVLGGGPKFGKCRGLLGLLGHVGQPPPLPGNVVCGLYGPFIGRGGPGTGTHPTRPMVPQPIA